jgi:hypothetical protein
VFFGTKAYRYLSTAEGAVEDVMSAVKTTIIVRSIVVMRDNLTANLLQLHMNGMSLPEIGKKMISKFLEITEYVQNKSKITTLERQYTSAIAKQNQTEAKKLRAKIAALEDANASMSIDALIKAGEFNTISESLTEADVAIRDSKFGEWLERRDGPGRRPRSGCRPEGGWGAPLAGHHPVPSFCPASSNVPMAVETAIRISRAAEDQIRRGTAGFQLLSARLQEDRRG